MTTRAGLAGILCGFSMAFIIYGYLMITGEILSTSAVLYWTIIFTAVGGGWSVRNNPSMRPMRRVVLGGLAGGLGASIVFCLWGAAAAASTPLFLPLDQDIAAQLCPDAQSAAVYSIIHHTLSTFLVLFFSGCGFAAFSAWLSGLHSTQRSEYLDKTAPKMALNVAITLLPASLVAAVLAAAIFTRLADTFGASVLPNPCISGMLDWPLSTALFIVLAAHLALALVIPHEARQAEHRCALDEVKMGAYVSIGAAPLLNLLLFFIRRDLFLKTPIVIVLLLSTALSLASLHTLLKVILPRRVDLPAPIQKRQKIEAGLFGSITDSDPLQLIKLCIGCGWMMFLPLYICVVSVWINLSSGIIDEFVLPILKTNYTLFWTHAFVSSSMILTPIVILILLYLFYLHLGRSFNAWNKRH